MRGRAEALVRVQETTALVRKLVHCPHGLAQLQMRADTSSGREKVKFNADEIAFTRTRTYPNGREHRALEGTELVMIAKGVFHISSWRGAFFTRSAQAEGAD